MPQSNTFCMFVVDSCCLGIYILENAPKWQVSWLQNKSRFDTSSLVAKRWFQIQENTPIKERNERLSNTKNNKYTG
jgi:hypothetical protein